MTKISWICDYDCMIGEGGGGELSERAVITEGIRRGHDIVLCTPNTPNKNSVFKSDLAVIGNASRFPTQFLAQVSEQQEIVNYIHDFWPLCGHRLFYSALDKCKTTCPHLPFARKMLLSSSLNIFLSPLHKKMWLRAIPELKDIETYLHVSPVDTKLFVPLDVPKIPNSTLCVNCLLKFKDLENVIQYAGTYPERTITCVGAKAAMKVPPNVIPIGGVSQEEMPGMYAQTEEFLHLPNYCEPCGRSVIEAKLCGAQKLVLNKLVGVASFKEFTYDRDRFAEWIADSSRRFWYKIEKDVL